jgi:hypothetical protein
VCSEIGISAQSPGVSVESDQLDTEFYDSGEQFLGERKRFGGLELQVLLF